MIKLASATDAIGGALGDLVALLQLPILICAIAALLVCALEVGRFIAELHGRGGKTRKLQLNSAAAQTRGPQDVANLSVIAPSQAARTCLMAMATAEVAGSGAEIEAALADYEAAVQKRLERCRLLVRVGPAVGLVGTLVPLAPGLAALGRGDIAGLADELRMAFAATVIGLLVGTTAFALTLVRTRIYSEDLLVLERVAGRCNERLRLRALPVQPTNPLAGTAPPPIQAPPLTGTPS